MADEDNDTEAAEAEAAESGGGKKKLIVFGIIGLALLAGGIFAGPVVMDMISPPEEETVEADADAPAEILPELYASLRPPLVVNFKDSYGDSHYMQITMEVMAREQKIIDDLKEHIPVIRNGLILLYGAADYDAVVTRAGKEQMLADGLAEIQSLMSTRTDDGNIEAVYFTSLVIQ